jgi:prephenate dehydrogenase
MSALEHDRTVAITSHVPQVVASVLAAQLLDLTDSHVQVSGQGLRDMTRIASSNPQLWSEILLANAAFVGPLLAKISTELAAVAQSLSSRSPEEISSAISRGNQGRALVPGKHGDKPTLYETVSIMIQDAPGQLAAIFAVADQAEVNVEDVRIDHALGKAVAIVELDVDPAKALSLREALISQGWTLRNNPHS